MPARALIVLLLILNLGVALWWVGRDPAPPASPVDAPAGMALLELLDAPEPAPAPAPQPAPQPAPAVAPAPAPTATAAAVQAPAADAAARCRSFGPYADAAAADRAEAALRPLVRTLARRQAPVAARGWRVVLPGQTDRAAAAATASRLVAAGFSDHYLMPAAADGRVDIALGRFGSEAAARRHQQALAGAGFAAVAEPLGEPGAGRYWIDVAAAAGRELADLQRASGAARSEELACAALAAR